MPNSATLVQALGAAFCAILCALSSLGGGGMMIGARTAAWAKTGSPLPYLRRVAYLESHNKEYIDTGLVVPLDSTSKAEIVLEMVSLEGASTRTSNFFGASNSYETGFGAGQETNLQICYGTLNRSFSGFKVGGVHTIALEFGIVTVDGVSKQVTHSTNGIPDATMILFGMRRGLSVQTITLPAIKVYSFKYSNRTTSIDLIPVLDLAGRPCMYNQAPSDVQADDPSRFFYNQGTGEFTWGELET